MQTRKPVQNAPAQLVVVASVRHAPPDWFRPTEQTTKRRFSSSGKGVILAHCAGFLLANAVGNVAHMCKNPFSELGPVFSLSTSLYWISVSFMSNRLQSLLTEEWEEASNL